MSRLSRVALLCGVGLLLSTAARAEEWQLAKDQAGIRVYLKAVPGSRYKAYRGVTIIRADMARVRALQEDVSAACAWIHECSEQRLLKLAGGESWTYTRFNTPWPVTPRDSVLHISSREEADGSLTRIMRGVPDYLPQVPGFVRVSKVEGLWTLSPKAGEGIEVIYEAHSEPGGSVPSWLANSFVLDAPYNTLMALRRLAERP